MVQQKSCKQCASLVEMARSVLGVTGLVRVRCGVCASRPIAECKHLKNRDAPAYAVFSLEHFPFAGDVPDARRVVCAYCAGFVLASAALLEQGRDDV